MKFWDVSRGVVKGKNLFQDIKKIWTLAAIMSVAQSKIFLEKVWGGATGIHPLPPKKFWKCLS
jgi:uncharacterized membrane protein